MWFKEMENYFIEDLMNWRIYFISERGFNKLDEIANGGCQADAPEHQIHELNPNYFLFRNLNRNNKNI